MFGRILKLSTLAGLGGYTTYVLHQNDWNIKHIGLVRFGAAAVTFGEIAFDYKYSVSKLRDSSDETLKKWSDCHKRSAERLLDLCCKNGGVFIKVGQHIAALDYLVPEEYVKTLKVLHNQAPRSKLEEIKAVIKKELGKNCEDIFDEFDDEAIASASLAQVYRAKLKNSDDIVAVKVQHPKVFKHSIVDVATMEFLFKIVEIIFPEFPLKWLVDETRRNIPLELDFINEGENAEKISKLLDDLPWLKIPKIYWKYTTKRILMMEFVEGRQITDKEYFVKNHLNLQEIVDRFENIYNRMIFTHGVVHCDPHPGNVLVKKKENSNDFDLYLLDHGLYSELTDEFRQNYCSFWLAMLRGNFDEMKRICIKMNVDEERAALLSCMISAKPWSAVSKGLENRPTDQSELNREKSELRNNASRYMNEIAQILGKVNRQLLLVLKTNDLVRNISYILVGSNERRSIVQMYGYLIETEKERELIEKRDENILKRFLIHLRTKLLHLQLYFRLFKLWINSWFYSNNNNNLK